jgi:hypothetical protein
MVGKGGLAVVDFGEVLVVSFLDESLCVVFLLHGLVDGESICVIRFQVNTFLASFRLSNCTICKQ